ncbi:MAG: hypothetical protein WC291_11625 [Thermodesulfovibrionales bacterium]|jgi:heme exporter protein D
MQLIDILLLAETLSELRTVQAEIRRLREREAQLKRILGVA